MELTLFNKTVAEDDFDIVSKTVNNELVLEISLPDVFTITLDAFDTRRVVEVLASAIKIVEIQKSKGCEL